MLSEDTKTNLLAEIERLTAETGVLAKILDKSDKLITNESLTTMSMLIQEGKPFPEGSADPVAVALSAAAILNRKCEFLRKTFEVIGYKIILKDDANAQRFASIEDRIAKMENRTVGLMAVGGRA